MKLLFTLAALFVATSATTLDCSKHPYNVSGDPASYSNRCYRGNRQVGKCFFDQGLLCDGETRMRSRTRYECGPREGGECKAIQSTETQLNACHDRYCIISGQGSFIVSSGPRRRALAGRRLMPQDIAVKRCCFRKDARNACQDLAVQTQGFQRVPHWRAQRAELCYKNDSECPVCDHVYVPPRRRLAKRQGDAEDRRRKTPCGWNTLSQCSRTYFKTCADKVSPSAYQEYCKQWMEDDTPEQVSNDNEHAQKTPETDDRRMTVDTEAGSQKITTGSDTTVLIVCISLAVVFALALGVWVGRRTSEMKIPQDLEAEPISVETV